jgi:hypothetical protein
VAVEPLDLANFGNNQRRRRLADAGNRQQQLG